MAPRRPAEGNGSSGEARQGIRPRYRRAFGCVTWIYMATLAFLAVASLLLMPVWFVAGWNVFSILEGYAFFATLLFLPAMISGALLGARTYRSENRVATRNGAAIGTIIGWLGYAFVVWLEVNRDGGNALLHAFFPLAAISSALILYALFKNDNERGRKAVAVAAALAAVAGVLVLAFSGEALVVVGALVSAVAGAAAGWTGGIGYARAGGDDMIPPGATIKRREPRQPREPRERRKPR